MNDIVRQKLQYIITQYGRSICDEPKRCEALLRDLCPEYKREVNVLVSALKERVAAELMTASDALPKEFLIERLTKRLYDNLGIAEEFARWAVESWAMALGVISGPMPVTSVPKAKTSAVSPKPAATQPQTGNRYTEPLTGAEFVYIPPGDFMMGSPEDEPGRFEDETLHRVRLTRGFYMQTTQVTVGQWRIFVRNTGFKSQAETEGGAYGWTGSEVKLDKRYYWDNPGFSQADSHPVTCVSWNDAQAFITWLNRSLDSARLPATGAGERSPAVGERSRTYRLPTEAEWEYSCRAGTSTPFYFGVCLSTDQANYDGNYPLEGCPKGKYRKKTVPAASFLSNAWGLYDMHGNVWEWCHERGGDYPTGSVTDPMGPSSVFHVFRLRRGGGWDDGAVDCRSARRHCCSFPSDRDYDVGFRLVLPADQFKSVPKAKTSVAQTKPPVTPPQITVPAPFTSAPKVKKVVAPSKPLLTQPQAGDRYSEPLIGAEFVYIPPGEFMMGSPEDEPGRFDNETLHRVRLTRGFYMQTTQVTQKQWEKLSGYNPSHFRAKEFIFPLLFWGGGGGADFPVEEVSWNDAVVFCEKLSRKSGKTYRLPTEAEWEYACRAGTTTPFFFGKCLSTDQANYDGNYPLDGCPKGKYRKKTVPAASFLSNAWGLYDMHGNVWEWCHDRYGDYPTGSVTDPIGPNSGSDRVGRGGSWYGNARGCRSAGRRRYSPDLQSSDFGFRLVLSPSQQG